MDKEWQLQHARDMAVPAEGEDPEAPLPTHTAPPAKPQARLAKYFEQRWNVDALALHPEWRGQYRGIDMGAAIGYIRRTFLDAGYSDEHVEAMMDAFLDDLINPYCGLELADGQSAFQKFTGWWGHNPIPDPAIERERQAEHERILAAYRRQVADKDKLRAEAFARIDEALDQGIHPDPDDLAFVGLPIRMKLKRRVDTTL